MNRNRHKFGDILRQKRTAKGYSLRKFAELVGVSPTYLSQVEHGNVDSPTSERVRRMADLLSENSDEWIAMAGRVPDDLSKIILQEPTAIPELLREASGLTREQIRLLRDQAKRLKALGVDALQIEPL